MLRKQMEEFKGRYKPYIDERGWKDSRLDPDYMSIRGYGNNGSFAFIGSVKEHFVHGVGANIIAYSGGVVRSNDRPDVMCTVYDTLVSYNSCAQNFSMTDIIDVETQTEVTDLDLTDDGSPNGLTIATPDEEKRYSEALEVIRNRNIDRII